MVAPGESCGVDSQSSVEFFRQAPRKFRGFMSRVDGSLSPGRFTAPEVGTKFPEGHGYENWI